MRLVCALSCLSLAAASFARAESGASSLSESEFLRRYRAVEPRFELAAAGVAAAEAGVEDARRIANPAVEVEREAVESEAETLVSLGLTLDLGARGPRIDSAEAGVRAAREQGEHEGWGLVIDALGAYYDAVQSRERVVLLDEARAPLAQLVELLATQAKAGESAGYERDRLELELARYDERLAEARSDHRRDAAALAALLGDPDASVDAGGSLTSPRPPELAALAAEAGEQRADVRAAAQRRSAADAAATAAGRWWIPTLALGGGVKTVSAAGVSETGYFVGASLEIPLFERGQTDRRRAAAARGRAGATLRHLAAAVPGQVRDAHSALIDDLDLLAALERDQLPSAERLVERATLIYREGEGSVVELLDAHRVALEVRLRRLELQRRAKRHELALWRAVGRRIDGGGQ